MNLLNKIKNVLKDPTYLSKTFYLKYIETTDIQEKTILLECQQGTNLNGNIFYLLKELCNNVLYKDYTIFLSVNPTFKENIKQIIDNYHLDQCHLLEMNTKQYFKVMASAKYLINDNTFLPFFIKRDEQIYLNTWHGTPLKTLGKKIKNDFHNIGNPIKNFVVSDYLLYPNEFTRDCMIEDYMLENISNSKVVINGYPRNSIFFDKDSSSKVREEYKLNDKKVIAYMPTWRGSVANKDTENQNERIFNYLKEIDMKLSEDCIMYVNLHPIVHSSIDYSNLNNIQAFPSNIDSYEFLNACDLLITDYSSVFFDYANTHKKIILFTYDLEEYLSDRGLYLSLDDLPFPKVKTVDELIYEINQPILYDDKEFISRYCHKENIHASKELLNMLLLNQFDGLDIQDMKHNGKENVLIYAGNLAKNGVTTALFNLLNNLDLEKRNYYLTFISGKVAPYKNVLHLLPKGVNYIPTTGKMNASILEKIYLSFTKKYKFKYDLNNKILDKLYKYEIKRCFGNISFSNVIQYNGYEFNRQMMFGRFDCDRTIFVHSNMVQEMKVRKNQHPNAIRYAYNHYDHVAIVTEDMREPTLSLCDKPDSICVVNNIIDYKNVLKKSKWKMSFDENTTSNKSFEEIKEILNSTHKKFITIGRFSPEKGHIRLLNAFEKFQQEESEPYLIIIGGHGPLYDETLRHAQSLKCYDHVILIRSLSNPYAFLKKCDYFVFTSFYEAFGLGLVEADILGIPAISTDILGPRGFMTMNHGTLVYNDETGIYEGMKLLYSNKVNVMNVDYKKYNQAAIQQFEDLLK